MVYDFPSMMRLVSARPKNGFVWQKIASFVYPRSETSTDSGAGIASPPRIRCTRSSCAIARYICRSSFVSKRRILSSTAPDGSTAAACRASSCSSSSLQRSCQNRKSSIFRSRKASVSVFFRSWSAAFGPPEVFRCLGMVERRRLSRIVSRCSDFSHSLSTG